MLAIRRLAGVDMPTVTAIVRGLPDYFTSDVPGRSTRPAASRATTAAPSAPAGMSAMSSQPSAVWVDAASDAGRATRTNTPGLPGNCMV
jgi:hypothetical protein